jgi:hypothetical protein
MSIKFIQGIFISLSISLLAVFLYEQVSAQDSQGLNNELVEFEIEGDADDRITIPFELINNLVVIEASINGSEPLKFILDTGVSKTLITSIPAGEGIYVERSRTVTLSGLGAGEAIEAYFSAGNDVNIERVTGKNMDILFLKEDIFNLSSFMGTNVHGLIGYDLFSNFAVEVNYRTKEILLYHPDSFVQKFKDLPKHRKWHKIPISIEEKKAYVEVSFKHMPGSKAVPLKLIIDSGSSNAFSLYHLSHDEIMIPESRIETLIGVGLSGKVHGYLGRAQEIELGGMKFNTPIIAYPDSTSIRKAIGVGERNGSLGGEVLRRFKVIFHYPNSALYLRKNRDFDDDFNYNMSGIELNTPFPNIPFYVVSEVREDSPAAEKGVKAGDAIKYVDGERATDMNLNEMIYYLQKREGRKVQIGIQRDSLFKYISISLDNKLTVDEPRN